MKEFDELLMILECLLGPGGCPWDQEQTLISMRELLLEETCEVIDAVNSENNDHMQEELGDLLFNVVFCCRLAQKEGRFTLEKALKGIAEKLIRRHPHVFGEAEASTTSAVLKQWEEIKKAEKGAHKQASVLDRIPRSLPALARAQEVLKKMTKANYPDALELCKNADDFDEETFARELLMLTARAQAAGIDAEMAVRKALVDHEEKFKNWETNHS